MNAQETRELLEWLKDQVRCAVCWWPSGDGRRQPHVHHIAGGFSRSKGHDKRNYLRLCQRCHDVFHSGKIAANVPDITREILLGAKQESDASNYDPEFLAWLKNKVHLGYDPAPIPQYFLEERERNGGKWGDRKP